MFVPWRCPYPDCPFHRSPRPLFFTRRGFYRPRCRNHPVPRFRCRHCRRTFSRQSFRADFRHKKPHLNAPFLRLMVSCVGLRQAARVLQVARRTVEHRFSWLARHARHLHLNQLRGACLEGPFQLDELESFESNRFQPLTVPVLIEAPHLFMLTCELAPLRRKGRMTLAQRRRRSAHEALHGRRPSHSDAAVRRTLETLKRVVDPAAAVVLDSDHKPSYGLLGAKVFGERFIWRRHAASARRDRANPLFPINHTNARLRHFLARLRRRTWCVSKCARGLAEHLAVVMMWVNYSRGITNRTRLTPAQALGLAQRTYRPEELVGWRQDWAELSPAVAA
jgi:transposase-like protein